MPRDPAPNAFDEIAMRYMEEHAPICDTCGGRYQLGGLEGVGPLLVCTTCSFTAAPSDDWLERTREEAFDHAERSLS